MDDFSQLTLENTKKKVDFIKNYLKKIIQKLKPKKISLFKNSDKFGNKVIYKDNKNQISMEKTIIKKRNAGIDLLRVISMIGIVYNHVLFQGRGIYKYNRYKIKIKSSLTYIFWHDNVYALLSGIVGYKSTKYSNLFYLWLSVIFYSLGFRYYYLKYKKVARVFGKLYEEYYPAVYGRYWYFSSYFGMFIFLPAINKGVQYLNKSEFNLLVMSIFGIYSFWHTYHNSRSDFFRMHRGLSTIWLLCLYIMGVYIGKFNIIYSGIKRYIICFIYLFLFLFLCYLFNQYSDYTIKINKDLQKIIQINNDILAQTINLINQNFSFYNNNRLSICNGEKEKELYIFKKEAYIVIQKVINFSIIENNKTQSELGNVKNSSESYPSSNGIFNFKKFFGETCNSYPKESNKIQKIIDDMQRSSINNIIEKNIVDLQANNEIKVLKNNKVIYLNKYLLNSYSTSRAIKKFKKINFVIRKKRSSKYRGVSMNGRKWQVLIMINKKKNYLGNYLDEDLAARVYDIQAIKTWGIKARTNFVYNKNQIMNIYNKKIDIKCNDISDILAQINN